MNELLVPQIPLPLWQVAWLDQDELNALQKWEPLLATARLAATNSWHALGVNPVASEDETVAPLIDYGDAKPASFYDRCRFLISSEPFSLDAKMIRKALEAETYRNLAVAAIGLKRYQLKYGRLPGVLSELVPEFLPAVPLDRMDGQRLRYRAGTDDTFLLYSVGYDGHDDGGDPTVAGDFIQMWRGRDAVWPMPASAEEIQRAQTGPAKLK